MLRPAALAIVLVPLAGCGFTRRLTAGNADYEAYRETRAAYTVEDRLAASMRYLAERPEGRFADEVRGRFEREEAAFYASHRATIEQLDWYLYVLPRGPHASEASLHRAELAHRAREASGDELLRSAWATERRLARAAVSRRQTVDGFVGFVSASATQVAWGAPTWQQPREIIDALREGDSPGRCDDLRCNRVLVQPFVVPLRGGGLDERAATIEVSLSLVGGGVAAVEIKGPELFSRIHEASLTGEVSPDALEQRALAVAHVLDIVTGAFEVTMPSARCETGVTPPVALRRACDGLVLEVRVAGRPDEDDGVLVRREPPPRPPR